MTGARVAVVVGMAVQVVGVICVLVLVPFGFNAEPDVRHGAAFLAVVALLVAFVGRLTVRAGRRRVGASDRT